ATGSVPKELPNVPVDHVKVYNSDSILELPEIPKSIIVLGAGAVGCEFASLFAHLGSQTTLVEFMPNVLPIQDREASKELETQFRRRTIGLGLSARVQIVERGPQGVKVSMDTPAGPKTLEAQILLSAVGRSPVTEDVGLEKTAIKLEKGFIPVDDF